ncbi:DUF805 domain-containing protein [Actinoplanes ianthinogenes]|uniref:DUF805 domain-containing protein n=1 Tax=Actinoplanes ianthinogenes TaxID=122358 RepID=A0ABN6CRS0_9ACTN|nr:DUF805 domain-containing protein [Actinoplanes ianthinogenes]BCJ47892.1 DUF805 domain-containing protein [Actinoplanes ianthinogenes]GGR04879.1 DUF805 domain-containing protein [Actinoplanes ianthinogenes]
MSFLSAVRSSLTQYVGFRGRARRSEFWWFTLFSFLISLVASVLDLRLGTESMWDNGPVSIIVSIGLFLPSLAVTVRRLHDTDRSGWWLLACFVPLVGFLVMLVFLVLDGGFETNRFGVSPKVTAVP